MFSRKYLVSYHSKFNEWQYGFGNTEITTRGFRRLNSKLVKAMKDQVEHNLKEEGHGEATVVILNIIRMAK